VIKLGHDIVSGRFRRVPGVAQGEKTNSYQACANLCRKTDGCQYFVRRPSTGECWLGNRLDDNVIAEREADRDLGYVCPEDSVGKPVQLVKLGGEACSSSKPCEAYHGDCDSDSECAGDLICVPDKETGSLSGGGVDYCLPKAEDWRARRIEESEEALEEGHTVEVTEKWLLEVMEQWRNGNEVDPREV